MSPCAGSNGTLGSLLMGTSCRLRRGNNRVLVTLSTGGPTAGSRRVAYGGLVSSAPSNPWPAILTWRAPDAPRMESVRVQLSGNRIRANGRIVSGATADHPAFGVYYDLHTDESGATKRLGLTVSLAERERQLVIARDEENMWLVTDARGQSRAAYDGALDIDMLFSPFFNTLPIRRARLQERAGTITLPTLYLNLPDMTVVAATASYSSAGTGDGIKVISPGTDARGVTVTVDADGFVIDYPGLATRI